MFNQKDSVIHRQKSNYLSMLDSKIIEQGHNQQENLRIDKVYKINHTNEQKIILEVKRGQNNIVNNYMSQNVNINGVFVKVIVTDLFSLLSLVGSIANIQDEKINDFAVNIVNIDQEQGERLNIGFLIKKKKQIVNFSQLGILVSLRSLGLQMINIKLHLKKQQNFFKNYQIQNFGRWIKLCLFKNHDCDYLIQFFGLDDKQGKQIHEIQRYFHLMQIKAQILNFNRILVFRSENDQRNRQLLQQSQYFDQIQIIRNFYHKDNNIRITKLSAQIIEQIQNSHQNKLNTLQDINQTNRFDIMDVKQQIGDITYNELLGQEILNLNMFSQQILMESTFFTQSKIYQRKQSTIPRSQCLQQQIYGEGQELNNDQLQTQPQLYQLYDNKRLDVLKQINQLLRCLDFLQLRKSWQSWLRQFLLEISDNFEVYQLQLSEQLYLFVRHHQFRLYNIRQMLKADKKKQQQNNAQDIYEHIFPGITGLLQKLLKKLRLNTLFQERQDFVYKYRYKYKNLIEKQEQENKLKNQFYSKLKKELSNTDDVHPQNQQLFILRMNQLIRNIRVVNQHSKYGQVLVSEQMSNLFFCKNQNSNMSQCYKSIQHLLSQTGSEEKKSVQKASMSQEQKKKKKIEYFQQIQYQRVVNISCLGCVQFLYRDMNIYQSQLVNYPLKVFFSIKQIDSEQTLLKDTIDGMLNSGGGVILFDCDMEYQYVKVRGCELTEVNKESVQHKMVPLLDSFYPKIREEVTLSFVPVFQNPYSEVRSQEMMMRYVGKDAVEKQGQCYYRRNPLPGIFVTRLVIVPVDRTKVYFYWPKNKQLESSFFCNSFQEGSHEKVTMRSLSKLIKKKFKQHSFPANMSEFQKNLLKVPSVMDHKCVQPQAGIIIGSRMLRAQRRSKPQFQKVQQYKNIILILCKVKGLTSYKNHVDYLLKGIHKYKIQDIIYPRYQFHKAQNTLLLYHNEQFNDIQKYFTNSKQFELVNVLKSLRIVGLGESSQADVKYFSGKVKKLCNTKFPSDKISFQQVCINKNNQFYVTTDSKETIMFLYFFIAQQFNFNVQFSDLDKTKPQKRKPYFPPNLIQFANDWNSKNQKREAALLKKGQSKFSKKQKVYEKNIEPMYKLYKG